MSNENGIVRTTSRAAMEKEFPGCWDQIEANAAEVMSIGECENCGRKLRPGEGNLQLFRIKQSEGPRLLHYQVACDECDKWFYPTS